MVTLRPVIEVSPLETSSLWPAADLVGHVPLSDRLATDEVGALLHVLAVYNLRPSEEWSEGASPADLAEELQSMDGLIAPGGLQVHDSTTDLTISPSCCSGLEDWREWGSLVQGDQPFLGHSPSPWVEILSDRFRVWPDDKPEQLTQDLFIDIPASSFPGLLRVAQRDLLGFMHVAEAWALQVVPEHASALLERLDECFDVRSALRISAE
ncbi:hypothetical protein Pth03_33180 [Planotetraspora thailandica]|uniref:Uncharacterized protein n=1 Tax=Planotetraspora thailandica TaxID=487172 RepID=A0A8J3V6I7_9ACTN|nr:hypothetical protein [Planotetraspora thailandica]GII54929.1 hypothetical protein Pth03_33180 [Planotetraspora thailandica]